MDKQEHGRRLKAAMSLKGLGRDAIADAAEVTVRTVTNWTSGDTMPTELERSKIRKVVGDYDVAGDPVEAAVRGSRLTEDRQYGVIGYYKKQLREQDAEEAEGRAG
jgi:transcriptional regulator with XRE-family HTH domain